MSKRILLVGHCGVDGPRMQQEIVGFMSDADVRRVNSDTDLDDARAGDVLLINREPLGFEPRQGPDLVRELHRKCPGAKLILVSDYEDAQQEASQAGALPGFGKSDLGSSKFEQAIRQALGA